MGVQTDFQCTTRYCSLTRELSEAKDMAMEEILNKASEAWLWTNASLFKHALEYKGKLNAFLDKAGGWIRKQEEHIWVMMFQITGDIRQCHYVPASDILLCLLETLPHVSGKPCIPEPVTHHLRVHARSLCSALVRASQPESCSHSIFWQPQEGRGHFVGGYHPQYRR